MGVKSGFQEATLLADFTPRAVLAAAGTFKSNASCLNYAKGYARGSRGFLKATLLADFTPRAMLAAAGTFESNASCLNYAKGCARGSRDF